MFPISPKNFTPDLITVKGMTDFRTAKEKYRSRIGFIQAVKNGVLIVIGIFSAAFGLKSFLLPNEFIDGGATGISLLLSGVLGLPLPIFILLVNIPFIFLGYKQIGGTFAIRTILAISGLALVLVLFDFPLITKDSVLVAVFGGFFLGAGIGFAIRGGGVLDGTEVLAIYVSRKTGSTIGDVIMIINIIIFLSAVYLLGVEKALYSMLTYLAASKTVDFLIEGIEEYTGVTIISRKSTDIREMISTKLGRGVTIYKGTGGYGKAGNVNNDTEIVFAVVTRLEISRLRSEIDLIDNDAFVIMHSIKDTKGGMIKKRPHDSLNRERGTATAGFAGIWICESEAPGIQAAMPVDLHSHQIDAMGFIHNKIESVCFIGFVAGVFFIKAEHITQAGASATLDSNSQEFAIVKAFFRHQPVQFLNSIGGKIHRC